MIKGITIKLHIKGQTGTDPFGAPVYGDTIEEVANVLVGEPDAQAVATDLQIDGKRLAYTLAIPKGDTHDWENTEVEFFGEKFRTYGATEGIEAMIPLSWNKKVKVERYE